jgi:kumamolisin
MPSTVTSLTAAEVAATYRFPASTGAGQRIALIELAGGYLEDDLDRCFAPLRPAPVVTPVLVEVDNEGLPLEGTNSPLDARTIRRVIRALSKAGATLQSVEKAFTADDVWSKFLHTLEVTMDVQIAGSLANAAAIDVYFASLGADGLAAAVTKAVATDPTVISISWGGSESWWLGTSGSGRNGVERVESAFQAAHERDITICCSSGDWGTLGWPISSDGRARVNYPASSPHALACGGTALQFDGGKVSGETVWNSQAFGAPRASGGGMSGLFPRPDHQHGLATPPSTGSWLDAKATRRFDGRWLPDVAAHADRAHGYSIVLGGQPFVGDGTSAAAPLWAALLARISEVAGQRVGWINERLYAARGTGCSDVTTGDNAVPGATHSYRAAPGWDPCTGWGSPDGESLVKVLSAR